MGINTHANISNGEKVKENGCVDAPTYSHAVERMKELLSTFVHGAH